MKNEKWFELSAQQVEKKLKTNAALGLSRKAARSRAAKNTGSVFLSKHTSPWQMLGELVSDFSLLLLFLAAFLSMFFEDSVSGIFVFALLCLHLLICFFTYFYCRRTMEKIGTHFEPKAKVIRDGKLRWIHGKHTVPGDVILLERGDVICADARLIHSDALRVNMRLDAERYTELDKLAEGFIHPGEQRPREMINMVHAGSVVLEGSARAIVTATGKYTYLGARTGGIPLSHHPTLPKHLQRLSGHCKKWNLFMLLTVLPLCLFSLLISHFHGGTVLLSEAFLTYMSLMATGISQLVCTVSILFYVKKIRDLLHASDAALVRSVDVLDRLGETDYLFLMDGALLTDGIWHFSSAYSSDGELNPSDRTASSQLLCELVSLYHSAVTETLSTGLRDGARYCSGMDEFLTRHRVDRTALRIRYNIQSYFPGRLDGEGEKVCLSDRGRKFYLTLSASPHAFSQCTHLIKNGDKQPWDAQEQNRIKAIYDRLISEHQIPLMFMISADGSGQNACFVGMLSFREGVDEQRTHHIQRLERMGCRVISFVSPTQKPAIPGWALSGKGISKQELISQRLPMTYGFGKFQWYEGFDEKDVAHMIDLLHAKGKKTALACFELPGHDLQKKADLMITSGRIPTEFDSQKTSIEAESFGRAEASSCTQVTQIRAELLVPRPSEGRGGLVSLGSAGLAVRQALIGCSDLIRYLLGMQLFRMILAVLPLLFGKPMIDARHLIFCSCILDVFAFAWFVSGARHTKAIPKNYCTVSRIGSYFQGDLRLILAVCSSALSILLLPEFVSLFDGFGAYIYRTEYVFTSMVFLHIVALYCVGIRSLGEIRHLTRCYWGLLETLFVVLFLLAAYTSELIGGCLSLEKLPLPYFALTLIPSVIFVLFMTLAKHSSRTKAKRE